MIKISRLKKFCTVNYNSKLLSNLFNKGVKQKKIPCFEVYSSQIEILSQPIDYYLAIIKLIRTAKSRIVLSSLYLGTGKMEEFIVEEIFKAIQKNNRLNVTILLDKSRGTREDVNGKNSLYLLTKLKQDTYPYAKYVNISFFGHPYRKNFYDILPGILSEVVGVLHTKILVFDDYAILSGANLSHDYFSNRQDRYYIIQNCSPLCDYLQDFVMAIANVSFQVDNEGNLKLNSKYPNPYKNKADFINSLIQQLRMFRYDNRVKIPMGEDLQMKEYFQNIEQFNNYPPKSNSEKSPELKLIEFSMTSRDDVETILPESLQYLRNEISFNRKDNFSMKKTEKEISNKVLIMPIIQFSPVKENDDKEILLDILTDNSFQKILFSTAYINFPEFLIQKFKEVKCELEFITSSPQANSFYKAGFLKGSIPNFYRYNELKLLKSLKGKENVHLYEFRRDLWTFHSKGVWIYENSLKQPNATIIGSSNYNYRSYERDYEMQFFLYSFCDKFNLKLENEVQDSFLDSFEVDENFIRKDRQVKIKQKTKLFGNLLRNYL